ncbi:uncharacterized protein LOC111701396 [Eurytemora carolleeae]|uniref:uncharacterized protein LOC111701396 n=1 Tax=Eurytemora carolleeae TaxID=1294199 RepID=UPI000C792719|nr:uncharacterized protein LOC111701396 [Eurytemora carolleeae]|eukprot:XP_023328440.1 uncharacterized protein LOC111701396 [Eurytemora affinis]
MQLTAWILVFLAFIHSGCGIRCFIDNKVGSQICATGNGIARCAIRTEVGGVTSRYCIGEASNLGCTADGTGTVCICESNECNESATRAGNNAPSLEALAVLTLVSCFITLYV